MAPALVIIGVTDIVGPRRCGRGVGDDTADRAVARHGRAVGEFVPAHAGRTTKYLG